MANLNQKFFKKIFYHIVEVLSLDRRALATTRICAAILIISDLFFRSFDIVAHYSDEGVLPRDLLYSNWAKPFTLSLHLLSGDLYFQIILFICSLLIAILLLFGYQTRLVTILSWLMLISLQNRNPLILQGGDVAFRLLLFWGMFVPWGDLYSIDYYRKRQLQPVVHQYLSVGAVGFTIQLISLYFFSALLKSGVEWRSEYSAVYYALSIEQFTRPLGQQLLKNYDLTKFLTWSTWKFEFWAPLLFYFPIKNWIIRSGIVIGFILMHLSFALTMHLGPFSFVMITFWIALFPTQFIDNSSQLLNRVIKHFSKRNARLQNQMATFRRFYTDNIKRFVQVEAAPDITPTFLEDIWDLLKPLRITIYSIVTALFLMTTLLWNARSVGWNVQIPENINLMAQYLRLDQYWNMFSPYPLKEDGWYVVVGTYEDGSSADLFQKNSEVSWDKPDYVATTYSTERWRKYMMNLWSVSNSQYRPYYLRYLCHYPTVERDSKLTDISLYYVLERTLPNYKTSEPKPVMLERVVCQ